MQYTLKKSLGQHFLKDEQICRQITDTLQQAMQQTGIQNVLEVGPGAGAISKYIVDIKDINFKAVELDAEKIQYLEQSLTAIRNKILHSDFLEISLPFSEPFIVIGNFPYNISTQIVFRVLDWKEHVPVMIGMFQKEVADRIAAAEGSKIYGVISVLTQAFYQVTYLFDVPPESFTPPPKIMSGVIQLTRRATPVHMRSERDLFVLVKTAFNQRRKMLRNAVKALFTEQELADELFNKRAEQLSVNDFAALTFKMK